MEDFKKIQEEVIQSGEGARIRLFAYYNQKKWSSEMDVDRLQDACIATGSAYNIYHFFKQIKGASLKKTEDAFVESQNEEYCYYLARYIKGVNIQRLENVVIDCANPVYMYLFARYVKEADVQRLWKEVKRSGDKKSIDNFKSNIKMPRTKKEAQLGL